MLVLAQYTDAGNSFELSVYFFNFPCTPINKHHFHPMTWTMAGAFPEGASSANSSLPWLSME